MKNIYWLILITVLIILVTQNSGCIKEKTVSQEILKPADEGINKNRVIDMDFLIYQNYSVEKRWIHLFDGEPLPVFNEGDFFNLSIVDKQENVLFNYTFDVYFGYDGPMLDFVDYSDIVYPYRELSLRIPYNQDMKRLKISYYNNTLVYSTLLEFCNQNSVCDEDETYLSCWQDCRPWAADGICINYEDNHCDPDCAPGVDPDCVQSPKHLKIVPEDFKDFSITWVAVDNDYPVETRIQVKSDGTLFYQEKTYTPNGEINVEKKGSVNKEKLLEIINLLNETNFYDLNGGYFFDNPASNDQTTYSITVNINGNTYEVVYYSGSGPEGLHQVDEAIYRLTDSLQ